MRRALVTFATGGHEQLLELALPGFAEYADRHGYVLVTSPPMLPGRSPSWLKIVALLDALNRYEETLWLDADVVVCDPLRDIADEIPQPVWQALVRHHTPDGEVPNLGVWYLRKPMRAPLRRLWGLDHYLNHPWWEQAGMLDLLGYEHQRRPVALATPTDLYWRTHWLGLEWNSHEQSDRHPCPRFAHATHGDLAWRQAVMRDHLERRHAHA